MRTTWPGGVAIWQDLRNKLTHDQSGCAALQHASPANPMLRANVSGGVGALYECGEFSKGQVFSVDNYSGYRDRPLGSPDRDLKGP